MKLPVFAYIGLILGALGALAGVVVAAIFEPIVAVIVGGVLIFVFGLIYTLIVKPSMRYSRIVKSGIPATARIISFRETNTRINDQPMVELGLEVTLPGKSPYQTKTRAVISYFQAAAFQPGNMLNVVVDREDPMQVVVPYGSDSPPVQQMDTGDMMKLQENLLQIQAEQEKIKAIGVYCAAIVVKFTPLGVNVNGNNPYVELELKVMPSDGPAFDAKTTGVIGEASVPKFQPGEEIFVKYDPHDHSRVAIEHS